MKKIIIKLIILLFWMLFIITPHISYAYDMECTNPPSWDPMTIYVTEWVPWACCTWPLTEDWHKWEYKCIIAKWVGPVVKLLGSIIKYFTFLAWLGWVLYLVINGIMYSMWWMDQGMKDESKKRIVQTIVWLIVLFMSWVILNIIAPWIYTSV